MGRTRPGQFLFLGIFLTLIVYDSAVCTSIGSDNPHSDIGDCFACHVIPAIHLKNPTVPASIKTKLKADPVALCQGCHGTGFGHGIGKKPVTMLTELPLSADGSINCAMTCHQMHDSMTKHGFLLRLPLEKLCISCHDK